MAEIDQNALNGLAEKLDGLDLDETERAILDTLLERAAAYEPEVEGFGFGGSLAYSGPRSGADLSATGLKLGGGLGVVIIKPPPPPEARGGDDPLGQPRW